VKNNDSVLRWISYRGLFCAAASYNLTFAIVSGCFPSWFFQLFGVEVPHAPVNWPWVAGLIALFGLLYAYAALVPQHADWAIGCGLATKVLGPTAWLIGVALGEQSPRLFPLMLVGDIVWSFPFLYYLLRDSRWRDSAVTWVSVGLHLVACVGLLLVSPGTEANQSVAERRSWIQQNVGLWTAVWTLWSFSSISLLAFCVVWVRRIHQSIFPHVWTIFALILIVIGVICDLCGETVVIALATTPELTVANFSHSSRLYQWLSPAFANGLYCAAGLMLSGMSWHVGWLRSGLGVVGFTMWTVGIGLTIATIFNHLVSMTFTGGGVMLLFLPWAAAVGWRMRPMSLQPAIDD